jgi:small-conductance mechanosensitive channel
MNTKPPNAAAPAATASARTQLNQLQLQRVAINAQIANYMEQAGGRDAPVSQFNRHLHDACDALRKQLAQLDGRAAVLEIELDAIAQAKEQQAAHSRQALADFGDDAAQLGASLQSIAAMLDMVVRSHAALIREVEAEVLAPEVARDVMRRAMIDTVGRTVIHALRPLGFGPKPVDRHDVRTPAEELRRSVLSQKAKPPPAGIFDHADIADARAQAARAPVNGA